MNLALTFDLDWAKEEWVYPLIHQLVQAEVKATWFITNHATYLQELRKYPQLFELGIHPNFYTNSTHGAHPKEIVDHMLNLVPEAKCVRTHGLNCSSEIIDLFFTYPQLKIDSSLLVKNAPYSHKFNLYKGTNSITRIPIVWEDDVFIGMPENIRNYDILDGKSGPLVVDFHPVHIHLNSHSWAQYINHKNGTSEPHSFFGVRDIFNQLIENPKVSFHLLTEI